MPKRLVWSSDSFPLHMAGSKCPTLDQSHYCSWLEGILYVTPSRLWVRLPKIVYHVLERKYIDSSSNYYKIRSCTAPNSRTAFLSKEKNFIESPLLSLYYYLGNDSISTVLSSYAISNTSWLYLVWDYRLDRVSWTLYRLLVRLDDLELSVLKEFHLFQAMRWINWSIGLFVLKEEHL